MIPEFTIRAFEPIYLAWMPCDHRRARGGAPMRLRGGARFALVMLALSACGDDSSASAGSGATSGSVQGGGGAGAQATTASAMTTSSGGAGGVTSEWDFYGMPWSADALQNWTIGGPYDQRWSYRWRAPRSGKLTTIHPFFVPNPEDHSKTGYADGDGGVVRMDVCADDGSALHAPDCSVVLASVTKDDFDLDGTGSPMPGHDPIETMFPTLTLDAEADIVAGSIYHVVFTNIDAEPAVNWIGLDGLTEFGTQTLVGARPAFEAWGLLLDEGGRGFREFSLEPDKINTPVMSLGFADGSFFGCGYMEVWPSDVQSRAIAGNASVRERFTASREVTARSIEVRVRDVGATGALRVVLKDEGDAILSEASIAASDVPDARHGWARGTWSSPVTLVPGVAYRLALEAADGGSFAAHCVRDGQTWSFEPESVFADGHAEFDRGDGLGFLGWYGWSSEGNASYQDGDLQFAFVE